MTAAKSKRAATGDRAEFAQGPGSARNEALAVLASKGVYRDLADEKSGDGVDRLGAPALTGRSYDLGGTVEAVLVAPWAVVDGVTVFRGDVVRVEEGWLVGRDEFHRLAG